MPRRRAASALHGNAAGLLALWLLLIATDAVALFGVSKLEFGDGLARVFRSNSQRYADYQSLVERQGQTQGVLILIEGRDLGDRAALDGLTDFVLALQLTEGVDMVLSPFSVPIPAGPQGVVTLDVLAGDPAQSWPAARAAQPLLARSLSADRRSVLVTVIGDDGDATMSRIAAQASEILEPAGLTHVLTGLPVILARSGAALKADFMALNAIGAAVGVTIAVVAISGWWVAATTLLTSGTAILWGIGALGLAGVEINVISIALPILLMALSFSDAVHLAIEQRRAMQERSANPIRDMLTRMGPAVILTSLTTAIAFLTLRLSGSDLISGMGAGGAIAVIAAAAGALGAGGLLGLTALRLVGRERLAGGVGGTTRRFCDWQWLPRLGLRHSGRVAATGLVLTGVACLAYFWVEPRFSLHENLRQSDPIMQALARIDARLTPTATILVPVELNGGDPLAVARGVGAALGSLDADIAPLSIATLADSAVLSGTDPDDLLDQMPPRLRAMLTGTPGGQMVVTIPFAYQDAAQTRILATAIESALAAAPAEVATRTGRASGPEVMTSFVSHDMIAALGRSLIVSIIASGLLIALWLRSARAGLVALAPNLLPVATVGAVLALSGQGLSFAGGIALTLAFGIAVDDTIHVMNRWRLSADRGERRVATSMREVTPPMVVTTLVLVGGLSGTLAATLPTVVEFGILAIAVFGLALLADLVFLPALLGRFLS